MAYAEVDAVHRGVQGSEKAKRRGCQNTPQIA
jgi:hypothetical protein